MKHNILRGSNGNPDEYIIIKASYKFIFLDHCASLYISTNQSKPEVSLSSVLTIKGISWVRKVKFDAGCDLYGYLEADFTSSFL